MGMVNLHSRNKPVLVLTGLLVLSLSLSSCDSLRKKFIRQKKKGAEEQTFVPVLEPEEYPAPKENAVENYKLHYGLIKAWYKDLWQAIDDKSTARYLDYIIRQVNSHIDQMQKLVDAPAQADLAKLSSYLDYYKASLDTPWNVRNVSRIQSDLRGFDRYLRDHLRIDKIKGHLVQSKPAR
jgi:hypothetical protein